MTAKRWHTTPRTTHGPAPASARMPRRAAVDADLALGARGKVVDKGAHAPPPFEAQLLDALPHLTWFATCSGCANWFSERWTEYTGMTAAELEGFGWHRVIHADHVERVANGWHRGIKDGEAWEDTFPLRRRDGAYRWFLSRAVPVRDEAGEVVKWCGTGTDVTALYESDQRKDEFIGMFSHELRNPLAAIQTAVEIVRIKSVEPDLGRACAVLQRQSGLMTRLIQGLLEVSRISRGRVSLDKQVLDLRVIIDSVVESHRERMKTAEVQLRKQLPAQPAWVCCDRIRLQQVFGNVIDNAIRFNRSGGWIEVTLEASDAGAAVQVRDSGAGMDPATLTSLFQPFRRTGSSSSSGIGMGLTIANGLLQLHGGTIEASSQGLGAGSEVRVWLPLTTTDAEGRRTESGFQPIAEAVAVLLVEDNADAAQVLRELLELEGHHVDVAENAPAALRILRERGADAVLCDIGLPGMSGYELARSIRNDPSLRGTYLCALTGYGSAADRRRAREAGFDQHLTKPVDVGVIQSTLAALRRPRAALLPASRGA